MTSCLVLSSTNLLEEGIHGLKKKYPPLLLNLYSIALCQFPYPEQKIIWRKKINFIQLEIIMKTLTYILPNYEYVE